MSNQNILERLDKLEKHQEQDVDMFASLIDRIAKLESKDNYLDQDIQTNKTKTDKHHKRLSELERRMAKLADMMIDRSLYSKEADYDGYVHGIHGGKAEEPKDQPQSLAGEWLQCGCGKKYNLNPHFEQVRKEGYEEGNIATKKQYEEYFASGYSKGHYKGEEQGKAIVREELKERFKELTDKPHISKAHLFDELFAQPKEPK